MLSDRIVKEYCRINDVTIESLMQLYDVSKYDHQDFIEASDSERFVDLLHSRLDDRKVVVDTDYDCDGVMSGVILEASLKKFGFNVSTHYPSEHDGYGLTLKEADRILYKFPDVKLIVTADSGINCKEAIDYLHDKGVEVLVSDHHRGEVELFPDLALTCVDVNRSDKIDNYRFKHISGAQTAYKLMMLYAEKYSDHSTISYVKSLRVFAAISVLSDVMLIDNENRELVRELLEICNSAKLEKMSLTNEYVNYLREFIQKFGAGKITQESFGFAIIPTINSNRRMLGESDLAFKVFDKNAFVRDSSINALMRLNDLRKSTKKLAQSNMRLVVDEDFLKIATVDADQGILGLIASDLTNSNECASLVFRKSGDKMTASGRGFSSISIYSILEKVKQIDPSLDFAFGGHSNALGCGVSMEHFEKFCKIASDVSNDIFDESMRSSKESIHLDLAEIVSDEDVFDQISYLCRLLDNLRPLPYNLEDISITVRADKEEWLSFGFETFGKSNEHLKMRSSKAEFIGFFKFEEFYRLDLNEVFEMTMSARLDQNQIKFIIEKVRKIDEC